MIIPATDGRAEDLVSHMHKLESYPNIQSIMILTGDTNGFTPEALDPELQNISKPVFGGIFPEIIYVKEKYQKGTIIAGLTQKTEVHLIPKLSDSNIDFEDLIDDKISDITNTKAIFVFVGGFAQRISSLIDSLFDVFGLEINYIGGGAGSLSMVQKPCLFTNQGLISD